MADAITEPAPISPEEKILALADEAKDETLQSQIDLEASEEAYRNFGGNLLSPRREAFCREFVVDFDATKAALRIGHEEHGAAAAGKRYLSVPEVQREISLLTSMKSDRLKVTEDYTLHVLIDTVERCRQARPVLDKQGKRVFAETPDGEIACAYQFNANAVLKGVELLGKHLKMFTDKIELTGKNGGKIETETTFTTAEEAARAYEEAIRATKGMPKA